MHIVIIMLQAISITSSLRLFMDSADSVLANFDVISIFNILIFDSMSTIDGSCVIFTSSFSCNWALLVEFYSFILCANKLTFDCLFQHASGRIWYRKVFIRLLHACHLSIAFSSIELNREVFWEFFVFPVGKMV